MTQAQTQTEASLPDPSHITAAGAESAKAGAELLAISDSMSSKAAHDRELVNAWAGAIGMSGWYTWIPYKP